jgi:transposase-like protein
MTTRASVNHRRAIYDDDLQVRLDAAMARTRRFINSTEAVRASVRPPFTPYCLSCQQSGRTHDLPPTSKQHYICAHCHRRWVIQASAS